MTHIEKFKLRPLSHSSLESFKWDKNEWYNNYILGLPRVESEEMKFGKAFAKAIEDGKPMAPVTILSKVEQPFKVVFSSIPLIGFADTFDHKTFRALGEFKTSKTIWTQDRVNKHLQFDMYLLMNFITNKIKPEDVSLFLECVQTEQLGDFSIRLKEPIKVHKFKTKRTLMDILNFGVHLKKTYAEMLEFIESYPTLPFDTNLRKEVL